MALNVYIKKKDKQSSSDLLKEFTKLVKSSGVIARSKAIRYFTRSLSDFKKKANALKKLKRKQENERLDKLGKKRK